MQHAVTRSTPLIKRKTWDRSRMWGRYRKAYWQYVERDFWHMSGHLWPLANIWWQTGPETVWCMRIQTCQTLSKLWQLPKYCTCLFFTTDLKLDSMETIQSAYLVLEKVGVQMKCVLIECWFVFTLNCRSLRVSSRGAGVYHISVISVKFHRHEGFSDWMLKIWEFLGLKGRRFNWTWHARIQFPRGRFGWPGPADRSPQLWNSSESEH